MKKECPHCHEESFGWRELIALDYFSPDSCKACGKLVRNDGFRQLLIFPTVLVGLFLALVLFSLLPTSLQPFGFVAAIVLIALSIMLLAEPVKFEFPKEDLPSFTPDASNDKVVIVTGWNEEELHQIVDDFIRQDPTESQPRMEVRKEDERLFRLTFPEDFPPSDFAALINYLHYPFDFDLTRHAIAVEGKTTLDSQFAGISTSLLGKKAILYVPQDDQDYTVVYMQIETGDVFAVSLADSQAVWQRVTDARLPSPTRNVI
jgi:hypothetical protein